MAPKKDKPVKESRDKVPAKVDVETLAAILGVDARRVQQLSNEGVVRKAGRGQYDLVGSVRGYIKFWRDRAEGRAEKKDKDPKRGDWITRKVAAEAEKIEIANAEKRRTMVHINYLRDQVSHILQSLRMKVTGRSSRLAPDLHACDSVTDVELLLEQDAETMLAELQALGGDPALDEDEDAVA